MKEKLLNNILVSLPGSCVIPLIAWEPLQCYSWRLAVGLFVFIFCLGAFYGDDEFNVTTNWSALALKIKNAIGGIFAVMFFISAVLFMIGLIYIFHNQHN